MKDVPPVKCTASGGRSRRTEEKWGDIYDHFNCVFEWENGAKGYHFSRQQNGTVGSYEVELFGTKGTCSAKNRHTIIAGDNSWRYRGENNDMYQTEHDVLFTSIRSGKPLMMEKKRPIVQWLLF